MKAFVYTELQISLTPDKAPWKEINHAIKKERGFVSKTWLAGTTNNSLGGLYSFESIEAAQSFVGGYFPAEAAKFGVGQTTRIFNADITEEASRDANSVHFNGQISQEPGAFVYTEVQVNVPFENAPWQSINAISKQAPGFLAKTWLSGVNTNTIGGIYAFDTIENAQHFATQVFPKEPASLKAAFYTRIFDARATRELSIDMHSPFYARENVSV